jgi:EAL domain-containing protein (putative c-di-GMP-specific phosphodiesterase class I)
MMNPDLVEKIRTTLTSVSFPTQNFWLEVTEDTLIEDNLFILSNLDELKKMGVKIMIDDFGTGYSSFSYLQYLPVNGFKIDQSFTNNSEGSGQKIIKSLVELGHNLGLTTVAEGVETQVQKDLLKQLSCAYAQGYLMSRPLSAAAAEALLLPHPRP